MLRVLGYRVLIKPDKLEKTTESGIIIKTDENLDKHNMTTGVIVDIGKQAWTDVADKTRWAEIGMRVLYAKYACTWITDPDTIDPLTQKGVEYVLVADQDLLCEIASTKSEDK